MGGNAYLDNCGICVGGNTEKDACAMDCNGVWGGTAGDDCGVCEPPAVKDNCGTCDNDSSNDCEMDCNDIWRGYAIEDAKRAAGHYMIFNGTDPLISRPDEIERFNAIQESFFKDEAVNEVIVYVEPMPHKIVSLDNGEGIKVYINMKLNLSYLRQMLEENFDTLISVDEFSDLSYMSPGFPISLGDIDSDGLDEILYIKDNSLFAYNANNTRVNGFPVEGNFSGIPLKIAEPVCVILEVFP